MLNDNTTTKDLHLIERYLDLELSQTEFEAFHHRLQVDEAFRIQVATLEKANERFIQIFDPKYKTNFNQLKIAIGTYKQIGEDSSSKKIYKLYKKPVFWRTLVASLFFLFSCSYYLSQPNSFNIQDALIASASVLDQVNSDGLYSANLNRSKEAKQLSAEEKDSKKLAQLFQEKRYQEFIQTSTSTAPTPTFTLLQGVAWYHLKEYTKAQEKFEKVLSSQATQQDVALWGLVHVHLKQKELEEEQEELEVAKTYLKRIAEGTYPSSKKARNLKLTYK